MLNYILHRMARLFYWINACQLVSSSVSLSLNLWYWFFLHAPFSGSAKLNEQGKRSTQSKGVRWARLHLCTDHTVDEHDTLLPAWGSHTGTQVLCIRAARHLQTPNSQLEAELITFEQGNPRLMPLSSLLWVLLAFSFSGRDASKHGCTCSGWKDCTQARGASQGLGEERSTGEKQASYDFSLVFKYLGPKFV